MRAALALAALASSGCFVLLDHELSPEAEAELVVRPADFAGFLSWPSVVVGTSPDDPPHEATERTAYVAFLGEAPAADAQQFPVGTVVVKTGAGGEVTGDTGEEIHAMVKRGGGFNDDGAVGWEWFELAIPDGDQAPLVVWRGAEPPAGENYGCLPGQDCDEAVTCNSCHVESVANDYVQSSVLELGAIDESLLAP